MTPSRRTAPGHAAGEPEVPRGGRREAAEEVRGRILAAARDQFRQSGYDRTSLAEIGAAVGLTRGAVLYHFTSKPALLTALLEPFTSALDAALAELEQLRPAPRPAVVVDTVLELLTATRSAADLMARDIASRHALDLDTWFARSAERLVHLLDPASAHDPLAEARGYAALGALIRPLVHLPEPLSEPVRHAIRGAALNALRRPGGRASVTRAPASGRPARG